MREKFYRFMEGRNGADELARVESVLVLALLFAGLFTRIGIISLLGMAVMAHMYFRVLSKNKAKRREENQKYLNFCYRHTVDMERFRKRSAQRKTHRFFKCPTCRQKVRVPKGHGRIEITCPKCRTTFIRKS